MIMNSKDKPALIETITKDDIDAFDLLVKKHGAGIIDYTIQKEFAQLLVDNRSIKIWEYCLDSDELDVFLDIADLAFNQGEIEFMDMIEAVCHRRSPELENYYSNCRFFCECNSPEIRLKVFKWMWSNNVGIWHENEFGGPMIGTMFMFAVSDDLSGKHPFETCKPIISWLKERNIPFDVRSESWLAGYTKGNPELTQKYTDLIQQLAY